jgi:hypothetical protein
MTYDAVLVARRGLGVDEQRLATTVFMDAVRWAVFAESLAPELTGLRRVVETDPPDSLTGQARTAFMAQRIECRAQLKRVEAALFPPDEDPGDG